MDDPKDLDHFLGCAHRVHCEDKMDAWVMKYDMQTFFEQCVDVYKELVGTDKYLKWVSTPFVDEDDRENLSLIHI